MKKKRIQQTVFISILSLLIAFGFYMLLSSAELIGILLLITPVCTLIVQFYIALEKLISES